MAARSEPTAGLGYPGLGRALAWAVFLGGWGLHLSLLAPHVLSRDEGHAVLLAAFHPRLGDLFAALRYEGTPALWHLMLWGLDRAGLLAPGPIKFGYGLLLGMFCGVVVFGLRVPLLLRAALLLQVPVFWYAVNVRQYLAGALLTLLWGALRARDAGRWRGACMVVLALLAQCSLVSIAVSAGLLLYSVVEDRRAYGVRWSAWWWVGLGGIAGGAWQLRAPADLMAGLSRWGGGGQDAGWACWRQLAETLLVEPLPAVIFASLLGYAAWAAARRGSWRVWLAGAAIAPAVALDTILGVWKYTGERHHWSVTFGLIALAVVLAERGGDPPPRLRPWGLVLGALGLCAGLGWAMSEVPLRRQAVRSDGAATAAWIEARHPEAPWVVMSEYYSVAARAYLPEPRPVYSLDRGDWVGATRWNHPGVDYRANAMAEVVLIPELLRRMAAVPVSLLEQRPLVVVSGREVLFGARHLPGRALAFGAGWVLVPLVSFQNAQVERYRVYRVERAAAREDAG